MRRIGGRPAAQEADDWLGLCVRREWPRNRRAAEQRDELAPLHLRDHSITSSARPSNGSGTVMPSALAVLDLGRLVLHLVPMSAFAVRSQIDLEQAHAAEDLLRPLASMGRTPRINFDGFANLHYGGDGRCWSYTQLFRNGAIEAVKVRVAMRRDRVLLIPTLDFDTHIFEVLPGYLGALQRLDVPPPVVLMITLQGIRGVRLGVDSMQYLDHDASAIDRAVLELPEIMIERYGTDEEYQRAARPAFDALWNTGGFPRSQHYDETGRWDPHWRRRGSAVNPI
jgi:hypothetical protein